MKKVILFSVIAISSMFVAIGCGGGDDGGGDSNSSKADTESTGA
jgi:hypothetical protein